MTGLIVLVRLLVAVAMYTGRALIEGMGRTLAQWAAVNVPRVIFPLPQNSVQGAGGHRYQPQPSERCPRFLRA